MRVNRKTIKQLLIEEFETRGIKPPSWIDHMVYVITEKIKERLEDEYYKNLYLSPKQKREIIRKTIEEAVSYYIDTKDIVETIIEELKK